MAAREPIKSARPDVTGILAAMITAGHVTGVRARHESGRTAFRAGAQAAEATCAPANPATTAPGTCP
jgi:hypothetical protein